jgi:hypothetical protein
MITLKDSISYSIFHMSYFMCHMSYVICHISYAIAVPASAAAEGRHVLEEVLGDLVREGEAIVHASRGYLQIVDRL